MGECSENKQKEEEESEKENIEREREREGERVKGGEERTTKTRKSSDR